MWLRSVSIYVSDSPLVILLSRDDTEKPEAVGSVSATGVAALCVVTSGNCGCGCVSSDFMTGGSVVAEPDCSCAYDATTRA